MIRINVSVTVDAGRREELLRLLGEMGDLSRQEEGCLGYEILANVRTDTSVMIVETWAGEEALSAHKGSAHYARLIPPAKALAGRWDALRFDY